MGKLIIEGNAVYEVDEDCLRTRPVPEGCQVREAIERMEARQSRQEKVRGTDYQNS